ncbi:MAG: metallophosphoesterase [Parcubacteria group bacterium]
MKKIISICIAGVVVLWGGLFAFYMWHVYTDHVQTRQNLAEAQRVSDAIPLWHKKIATNQQIKIGMITDTHVHPSRINRGDERPNAPRYLDGKDKRTIGQFVQQMNVFHPDFVVHLGDVIEGTKDSDFIGMQGLQLVSEELQKGNVPVYWAIGNHDLRSVTKEQFRDTLGMSALDQVFDAGDYRFIILDASYNFEDLPTSPGVNSYVPGKLPPQTLAWFKKQLETDKRVFVFIHQGTFLQNIPGDSEIQEDEAVESENEEELNEENINGIEYNMKGSIANAQELSDILKDYRVDAIFNGHMEARAYEVIDHTAHYSLTGTEKSETYPASFYELTISGGVPSVTMYYTSPIDRKQHVVYFESGEK